MKKFLKIVFSFFLLVAAGIIIYLNSALYHQPEFIAEGKSEVNADLLAQLRFLKTEMHNGAATSMQHNYPEGFLFMNALYGLSWCEVAKGLDDRSALYKEAHEEIRFACDEMESARGKAIFDPSLSIPYGVFYAGWCNYLLGKKLGIEDPDRRDPAELFLFHSRCRQIERVLDSCDSPYPESYTAASWPSDATVAVASLAEHNRLFGPEYKLCVQQWIEKVKTRLDPNGLMPHSVYFSSGKPKDVARGNSQSLILNFLFEIDSSFARQQFRIYQEKFLDSRFGLPGIRESPKGETSDGDVDSGPVIFGIGGAASLVGQRTMALYGEKTTAIGLRNSIEAFGTGHESNGQKKYLFGEWPMADAFIAWANSVEAYKTEQLVTNESWRTRFQVYSVVTLLLIGAIGMWMWGFPSRWLKRNH